MNGGKTEFEGIGNAGNWRKIEKEDQHWGDRLM
jgi:hypothetical protein